METETQWIKSKEALPSQRMRVQMKCRDNKAFSGYFDPDAFYGKWLFDECYGDERFLAGFQADVIEWRPL